MKDQPQEITGYNKQAWEILSAMIARPISWYENPKWRCINGHISTRFLKTEYGDMCLACHTPVLITDPLDFELEDE